MGEDNSAELRGKVGDKVKGRAGGGNHTHILELFDNCTLLLALETGILHLQKTNTNSIKHTKCLALGIAAEEGGGGLEAVAWGRPR